MTGIKRFVLVAIAALALGLGILQLSARPAIAYADCIGQCRTCCPPELYMQCKLCCEGPPPQDCCCF